MDFVAQKHETAKKYKIQITTHPIQTPEGAAHEPTLQLALVARHGRLSSNGKTRVETKTYPKALVHRASGGGPAYKKAALTVCWHVFACCDHGMQW